MTTHSDRCRKQIDKGMECLDRLCTSAERTRRAETADICLQRLSDYRAFLSRLESGDSDECAGLQWQLPDRAFDAENSMRVLLAEGLKTINDLRDSGVLFPCLAEFSQWADGADLAAKLREAGEWNLEKVKLPTDLFDELVAIVEQRKLSVAYDAERNLMVMRAAGLARDDVAETRVRLRPQAGDTARISVGEFFGAAGRTGVYAGEPVFVPQDCHHLQPVPGSVLSGDTTLDAYGAVLAGFATARESMYRHARKVSQYGHGRAALRPRDPVTLIGGVMVVAGAYLIGTATVPGVPVSGTSIAAIAFGLLLIISGAGLLFAAPLYVAVFGYGY